MGITQHRYITQLSPLPTFPEYIEFRLKWIRHPFSLINRQKFAKCEHLHLWLATQHKNKKKVLSAFLFHEGGTLHHLSLYYILIQNLATLLCEMRDVNKGLQFEVDDLKQKLNDANGDIKVSTRIEFPFL